MQQMLTHDRLVSCKRGRLGVGPWISLQVAYARLSDRTSADEVPIDVHVLVLLPRHLFWQVVSLVFVYLF